MTATMDALLTTEQFARRVGKSVSQVNRLASAGVLTPVVQAPGTRGARLWSTAEALAYLDGDRDAEAS